METGADRDRLGFRISGFRINGLRIEGSEFRLKSVAIGGSGVKNKVTNDQTS